MGFVLLWWLISIPAGYALIHVFGLTPDEAMTPMCLLLAALVVASGLTMSKKK